MADKENGWFERHVTEALERIEGKVDTLDVRLTQKAIADATNIARLEEKTSTKATVFGAVAGGVTAALGWIFH